MNTFPNSLLSCVNFFPSLPPFGVHVINKPGTPILGCTLVKSAWQLPQAKFSSNFLLCFNCIDLQYSSPTQQRWQDRLGTRGHFSYSSFGTCQYFSRSGAAGLAVQCCQ